MTRVMRGVGLLALVLAMWGCSDDTAGKGAPSPPDGEVVTAEAFGEAISTATGINADQAAVSVLEKARFRVVPADQVGGRDLSPRVVGNEATFSFDIDKDGAPESIYAFTPSLEQVTFLIWEVEGFCNLAWEDAQGGFHVMATCDQPDDLIACARADAAAEFACNVCRSPRGCEPCELSAQRIDCPEEVVDDAPNNDAPNNDTPNNDTPELCEPACGSGEVCVDGVCRVPDEPVTSGMCDSACMEQSLAQCCTSCGCNAEIRCDPVCPSGFTWDCEIGCCFDYDALACHCPEGQYDPEALCCAIDGVCL